MKFFYVKYPPNRIIFISLPNNVYLMKISILGGGNVAYHFAKFIENQKDISLVEVYNRNEFSSHFSEIKARKIYSLGNLSPVDIFLICVKDDAIAQISNDLPFENALVVHTSGNTEMRQLSAKNRRGVVYPAQSFSKEKPINFSEISLCIEAEWASDLQLLKEFSRKITSKVYEMDSQQRQFLHISAVFLNNFTNHLWYLSEKICREQQIPFEILNPLLKETIEKINTLSFFEAQTGPAKRGDLKTIGAHLQKISSSEKEIYQVLTNSILKTYHSEK